jgi:hypothetical protein
LPIIPAFERLRLEDLEYEDSLSYIVRLSETLSPNKQKTENITRTHTHILYRIEDVFPRYENKNSFP